MKKIAFLFIALSISIFAFASCGSKSNIESTDISTEDSTAQSTTEKSFDLESYKSKVSYLYKVIKVNYLIAKFVTKYEVTALGPNDDVKSSYSDDAFELLESKTDYSKDYAESIDDLIREKYAEIIVEDIFGKEAEELDKAIRLLYNAYSKLYKCAMSPSGTASSFSSKVEEILEEYSSAEDTLSLLLD